MATRTIENYLKQLYLEQQQTPASQPVAMGRLATLMSVVPGTATTMVKALADSGLVHYEPRTGVKLTPSGTQLALHVLRRHRLVELFLVRIVGLDWSEVHEEAEELEHVVSDKLLQRIDVLLGHPTSDPHGDPIPSAAGQLTKSELETLLTCAIGEEVEVARVIDQEPRFLQFVHQRGLTPGRRIRVTERDPLAESVMVEGAEFDAVTLSMSAAGKFLVRRPLGT